ncbi:MAG: hypothetical protein ACTHLE_07275 [Agriterribacter sp.]
MKPNIKQWVEAAKILAVNTASAYPCPECKMGYLRVLKDEKLWDNKIDRWIVCDHCKAYNTILMENPEIT